MRAAKIAIISADSEVEKFGDLLTATLSALTNVTVVERAQIQKVMQEQALALTQPQALVKAGRLLGAEGLILLERRPSQQTNEVLSVRLVAITPGVVILEEQFNLPLSNLPEWASLNSLRIQRVLPKLNVKLEDAVPVSIGSLRFSVSTGEGVALESELTALLRLRLAQEPSVFVLERRGLEALQTEKELGAVEEPFWNGAVVVDGTINRDLISRTNVTIHARLASPRQPVTELFVSGTRDSLTTLIDELTAKTLASLGKKGTLAPWQTEAEAEKFLQEAQWAANWGLWPQVADAADASWALGKRTPLVAAYRVTARTWSVLGLRGPPAFAGPPPGSEALTALAHTLEMYRDSFQPFPPPTNTLRVGWASLGLDLLIVSARELEGFHERVEFREGHEEDLRRVRALTREINSLLLTNEGLGLIGWRRNVSGVPAVFAHFRNGPVSTLATAWIDSGGKWFETPREAVAAYEAFLEPPVYQSIREGLLGDRPTPAGIPLTGWSVKDQQEIPALWSSFLVKMTASPDPLVRADGYRLIMFHSTSPDEIEQAAKKYVAIHAENRNLMGPIEWFSPGQVLSNALARIDRWGVPQAETLRKLSGGVPLEFDILTPEYSYAFWKDLLQKLTNANERISSFQYPLKPPLPEQLAELIAEFAKLEKLDSDRGRRSPVSSFLKYLRDQQKELRPPSTGPPEGPASAGTLTVSRVWLLHESNPPIEYGLRKPAPVKNMWWAEDRLWMETLAPVGRSPKDRPILISMQVPNLRATFYEGPFEDFLVPLGARHALVFSNELFICRPDAIWRRDVSGAWKKFPAPLGFRPIPYQWGSKIVVAGKDSIQAFDPASGNVTLLASMRRNPPVSALDQANLGALAEYSPASASMAVWPDNSLHVCISGTQVWTFNERKSDWVIECTAENCDEFLELKNDGVLCRQFGKCGPKMLGGWRPGMSVSERYTWVRNASRFNQTGDPFTPPLWSYPTNSFPHNFQACFDGPNVWVFPSVYDFSRLTYEQAVIAGYRNEGRDISMTMLYFDRKLDRALELMPRFVGPAAEYALKYQKLRLFSGPIEFFLTPKGLAMLVVDDGLLFWVPRDDIDAAIAQARKRQQPVERVVALAPSRFDRDGNGWLDDAESRTMRGDAIWQKERTAAVEAAIKTALVAHGAEWDKIFAEVDKNHDGQLSQFELDAAFNAREDVFAPRLAGVNANRPQVVRPFDLNSDSSLDRNEFRQFMADPRLPAELVRSPDWVARFGLKPELCDTNHDGILNAAERTRTYQMIRQRTQAKP